MIGDFLLVAGALFATPLLVFAAAVLLDHIIHGPNTKRDEDTK